MRSRTGALLLALTLVILPGLPAAADDPVDEPAATTSEPDGSTTPVEPNPVPTATTPAEPSPKETVGKVAPKAAAAAEEGDEDAEAPDPDPEATYFEVDNAELRWGLTNESNNMSHAAGRYNFFSAGRIPDPGDGGHTVTPGEWKRVSENVSIEKSNGSAYVPATWAGLKTTAAGDPITSASSRQFSDHQFVFRGGTGIVDTESDDATIQWEGDVTVIYYSGYTFFYLSDPELRVAKGSAKVVATLGGFASSQTNLGKWEPLPETQVTVADLGKVDLKPSSEGFTITPQYLKKLVEGVEQVRTGTFWGAFPQDFVAFQNAAGAAGFWFSSGSSFDEFKVPLPMTISYDAEAAIRPTPPPVVRGGQEPINNNLVDPPSTNAPSPPVPNAQLPSPLLPITPAGALAAGPLTTTQAPFSQVAQPTTLTAARLSDGRSGEVFLWWLGGTLLALAAASLAGAFAYSAASSRR